MPISWNEIRQNAIRFAGDWAGEERESAEKQTFWNEVFEVFGVRRRTVAAFEEPVKTIAGQYGYIDLFWRGMLLVEHKSRGGDLGKAGSQAFRYIQDLVRGVKWGRESFFRGPPARTRPANKVPCSTDTKIRTGPDASRMTRYWCSATIRDIPVVAFAQ